MNYKLQIKRYNERAILVKWPMIVDENLLKNVLDFKICVKKNKVKEIIEVVSSYNSILIIYRFTIDNINGEILALKDLYKHQIEIPKQKSKTWKIPVCYDDVFAVDINSFSEQKKLSKSQVIALHTKPQYTIYFMGFLPGFLYLGGLDSSLFLDRKKTPRLEVKKGAVAIGGNQTGIYPINSPGGWHIIGNSPVELFNPKHNPPSQFLAGDKVEFYAINKEEYDAISLKIKGSNYEFKPVLNHD